MLTSTVSFSTCTQCGAIVDSAYHYAHEQTHNRDSLADYMECMICASMVAIGRFEKHQAEHGRIRKLELLMDRLLGDLEAHLEYLGEA